MKQSANIAGYMPGLDGLRALAVFSVIAYHLNFGWAQGGLLGVGLFFVLSGFLITNILLSQWKLSGKIDLKEFWQRRAKRLLPALAALLAVLLFWAIFLAPERLESLKSEVIASVFYANNWYLIFHKASYFESFGPPSPLGHLWSLAIEGQFYLLWPLLLGFGLRFFKERKWIIAGTSAIALLSAVAMAMLYIPGTDPSRVYYGSDTRAFALLIGALLAMLWPSAYKSTEISCKRKWALNTAGLVGLLVVLFMFASGNQYQNFIYKGGLLVFSLGATCLIASIAHPASFMSRIFAWQPLRWIGETSYGIYLWHYPVIALSSPPVNTGGTDIKLSLLQIAVTVLLAALSRYLIEEPIRYGRKSQIEFSQLRKTLILGAKISSGMVGIFIVLFAVVYENSPILPKAFSVSQIAEVQALPVDEEKQPIEIQAETLDAQEKPSETEVQTYEDTVSDIRGDGITVIGDSLMVGVKPVLEEYLPGIIVDAKVSRQMSEAAGIIAGLKNENKLGNIVIIELGTNGSFTDKHLNNMLEALQEADQIVLINARVPKPWEKAVNDTLALTAESHPKTKLIDWYSTCSGHDEYFYNDGVHLNRTGAEAYSKMIVEALFPVVVPLI